MRRFRFPATAALFLTVGLGALAAADSATIFKTDLIDQVNGMEKKFVSLAEKMPEDKYSWRPGEGVRSISEVFVHIAMANMGLPRMAGVQPPANLPKDAEKTVTGKADVVKLLKDSFAHMRSAAEGVNPADLTKPAKLFGRDSTVQSVYLLIVTHMHEHLGQSIAYARTNSVVPPWSGN